MLGGFFMEELDKIAKALLLANSANMVNCSCGNVMEVV